MRISLAAARVNAGYNRDQAASELGIQPRTLLNYERGDQYPRIDMVAKMMELYHVSYDDIDFLLSDDTDKRRSEG